MTQFSSAAIVPQYWYVLEQLIPFDLTRKVKDLKAHAPIDSERDQALPWLNPSLLTTRFKLPLEKRGKLVQYSYQVYLGIFSLRFVFDFIKSLPQPAQADFKELVSTSKNLSCYAAFSIDESGFLVDQSLTCSTLPWALGRVGELLLGRGQLDLLDAWEEAFQAHLDRLRQAFSQRAKSNLENNQRVTIAELTQLFDWVCQGQWQPQTFEYVGYYTIAPSNRKPDDATPDILNSFYLSDLAAAASALRSGSASKPLQQYVSATLPRRTPVETLSFLQQQLAPSKIPLGRWPSNPNHNLSLMQQLAVNLAVNLPQFDRSIFSVNGPPGTGKTTLLRDLIANLLVERAEKLVAYLVPAEAFTKTGAVYRPHSSLTGFEILVASANNAAVENVTTELPGIKAIAQSYQNQATYFRTVAQSVRAAIEQAKQNSSAPTSSPADLSELMQAAVEEFDAFVDQSPPQVWGLIAAVLGNKENCNVFCEGFWWDKEQSMRVVLSDRPQTDRWTNARRKFMQCKQIVEQLLAQREAAWEQVKQQVNLQQQHDALTDEIANCDRKLAQAQKLREEVLAKQTRCFSQIKQHQQEVNQLQANPPSTLTRLFNRALFQRYQQQLQDALASVQAAKQSAAEAKRLFEQVEKTHQQYQQQRQAAQQKAARLREMQQHQAATQAALGSAFGDAAWWSRPHADLQLSAPWVDATLNQARTDLFLAAIEVHEQFVRQAATPIKQNLFRWVDMVKGSSSDLKTTEILALWQTFFLVVPIVSTTFASVGRLFHRLPPESIGTLLIDEAGQGIPQAAVGALQRAKQAIVVGDPLQIEPVFTLDPALVRGLQDYFKLDSAWNPTQASIQTLCDRTNSLGTELATEVEPLWIGCPLWVHRRCLDPMFAISNRIAYNNRMVLATPPPDRDQFPLKESRWIDLGGTCQGQHWIPAQGEKLIDLLTLAVEEDHCLPDLYIISPFKNVAFEIKALLRRTKLRWAKGQTEVDDWIQRSVGTVHTFQGKEADAVIFVLGADLKSRAAAAWAASTPNILNVAVTRAKYRFYIIGDRQLWGNLRYFSEADRELRSAQSSTDE